ncbi:hypothetical protein R5R35_002408 [Gryllus longicercus]|uniref:poly(ADP-ribose) glycohydrolase n=1 Tax=Gryllus longicercus TaxID=2509291 RepID=A0AAN9VTJ9_9ORTH
MSCIEPDLKRKKMNKSDDSPGITDLPSAQELEEMCMSPDPFEDSSPERISSPEGEGRMKISEEMQKESENLPNAHSSDKSSLKFEEHGGESASANKEIAESIPWKGCFLTELQKGRNGYGMPQLHPIKPNSNHTVMFQIGPKKDGSHPPSDAWDSNHVRLPCSPQNKYPVGDSLKSRWEMVKAALQKPVQNSKDLEDAIMSYNDKYLGRWDFSGLHYFFSEGIEEEETQCFFSELLPQIIELVLQLPALITHPLPLLRKGRNHSISLTQQQVACLLANAFFCTFPRRNAARKASEYATFPDINFNRLFQGQKKKAGMQRTCEKLKCIFHYFRRVCHSPPKGNITFSRRCIPPSGCPSWESSGHFFRKLHVSSHGTIEECGKGMLQVDFANKMVGGGVLGWGCVQEEIRFVICPELIIARLFTECLDATEALLITGCEQFSTYEGYADDFTWAGDYQDSTPHDCSGRKLCSVIAIDALYLRYPAQQFVVTNLLREINKAYVGFFNQEVNPDHLSAVATGNWGCGVYRGNTRLKALLQLMAATQTGRALAYFTFGDDQLRDDIVLMHTFLVNHKVTVGLVWRHLCRYYDQCYRSGIFNQELYDYLYKCIDPTYTKKDVSSKGRHTAVLSTSKMKTKQSNSNQSKDKQDKTGTDKSENTLTESPSKSYIPDNEMHASTDLANATVESSETKPRTISFDSKVQSRESKNSMTPTDKTKSQQHSLKKIWNRSCQSSHNHTLQQNVKPKTPSSTASRSPSRASAVRRLGASRSLGPLRGLGSRGSTSPKRSPNRNKQKSPSRNPIPPKSASLEFQSNNDIGGDEFGRSDLHSSFSENFTRPQHLTIQKRISDYFYEINVPK